MSCNNNIHTEYGAMVMDRSGTIGYLSDVATHEMLYLSRAGMDVCGITRPEEYKGAKCHKVLYGLDEPCPFCQNQNMIEGMEYRCERHMEKLGMWLDAVDSLVRVEGRLCRMGIARDITAQREEIGDMQERLALEDVLLECLNILAKEPDMDAALNHFLDAVGSYYQANRCYIIEYDMEKKVCNNTFEWCAGGVSAEIDNLQNIPIEVVDDWMRKFRARGTFYIDSLEQDLDHQADDYKILMAQGIQSLLAAPLWQRGDIVGFIGVDDPRRFQHDCRLLQAVSGFVLEELEKRRILKQMKWLSYTDALTELGNRNQYVQVMHEMESAPSHTLGVLLMDINGLKEINDIHGYEYGDSIIKRTAQILQQSFDTMVYRISGDEFVALCPHITQEEFNEKIVALKQAYDREVNCDVSIGFSWSGDTDSADARELISRADEMRCACKRSYYHTVLSEGRSINRIGLWDEVFREIQEGRFTIYYQPQVNIRTGEIIGAEALVRKLAEDGSIIPPGKFLPFYEVGGSISHVDLHVLRTACADLARWHSMGYELQMAVNFSRVTLMDPYIVDVISGICAEEGMSPSHITIEVTESVGKMDNGQLKTLISRLKAAGFSISLDDFGSQYSNLAILAALDFDEVKFDRSLVSSLEQNHKSRLVMKSGMDLCRELQGTVALAEGIETKGQLDLLQSYSCDYGQGYYFSKPIPADAFEEFIKERAGK